MESLQFTLSEISRSQEMDLLEALVYQRLSRLYDGINYVPPYIVGEVIQKIKEQLEKRGKREEDFKNLGRLTVNLEGPSKSKVKSVNWSQEIRV